MNNDVKKVPYIVYEAELYRCRKAIKALAVLLAVFFIIGILSNLCWKIAFDKATEDENTSESVAALIPFETKKYSVKKKRHKLCGKILMNTTFLEASG